MQSALIPSFNHASYFQQMFSAKVPEQIRNLLAQEIFQIEQWDFNLVILLNITPLNPYVDLQATCSSQTCLWDTKSQ